MTSSSKLNIRTSGLAETSISRMRTVDKMRDDLVMFSNKVVEVLRKTTDSGNTVQHIPIEVGCEGLYWQVQIPPLCADRYFSVFVDESLISKQHCPVDHLVRVYRSMDKALIALADAIPGFGEAYIASIERLGLSE